MFAGSSLGVNNASVPGNVIKGSFSGVKKSDSSPGVGLKRISFQTS